jgi:hypothetical protein
MKTILTLSLTIFIIFSSILNYSQELGWGAGEIYVGTYQQAGEQMISYRYRMTSVGPLWGGGPYANPPTSFNLNPSDPNYQTAIATFEGEQFFTNTIFSGYDWPHFRIIEPDDININAFGYGLYKFSVDGGSAYFFIDYRDDSYGSYSNCPGNDCADIWIKYESDPVDKFYYVRHDPDSEPGIDLEHSAWIPISNRQLLYYYKIKLQQSPSTDEFQDYWDNCLVVTPDPNNHPRLIWGPYPDDNFAVEYYKIYKKKGSSNFTLAHTTSYLNWIDTSEIMIFGAPQYNEGICYYKISAVGVQRGTSVETGVTNTVDTRVQGSNQEKLSSDILEIESKKFVLVQNYPNPFNPSTKIEYSIAENSFVSLKVYDILGNEVAELVNEYKSMGEYQIEFNAAELPSGIYLYTLVSGNYISTKKLILLK